MLSKQKIINLYKDNKISSNYIFLLAWSKFLNYYELMDLDQPEPYDAELAKGNITSVIGWNRLVIPYNEENVIKSFIIAVINAKNYYMEYSDDKYTMDEEYFNDIKNWLFILEDNSYNNVKYNRKNLGDFYNKILGKYFNINKK